MSQSFWWYLFRKYLANVAEYKYIKCKGDQQCYIRHYRNRVTVIPFLKYTNDTNCLKQVTSPLIP